MSENTVKHQPKCPICNVIGLEFITQQDSKMESKGGDPWFNVVHCSEGGHVYGVFNKVSLSPTTPRMDIPLPSMPVFR